MHCDGKRSVLRWLIHRTGQNDKKHFRVARSTETDLIQPSGVLGSPFYIYMIRI